MAEIAERSRPGPAGAKAAPSDQEFVLRIVSSNLPGRAGQETRVTSGSAVIGRGDDCTIVLKDNRVSRKHARIEAAPGGLRILDNGSANGVWVGDQQVSDTVIGPGTKFKIGETVIEYVPPPDERRDDVFAQTLITSSMEFIVRVAESKAGIPAGKEFRVPMGFAIIGRGDDATIVLKDGSASRHHARVVGSPDGKYKIIDTGSANGTWLDSKKITEEVIEAGRRFRIGDTFLECHPPVKERKDTSSTQVMSDLGALMAGVAAQRLENAGEGLSVGGSRVVLLDDPSLAYYVVSGKVEVFTVTVKDGKPLGARNHFLTLAPGDAVFGMDLRYSQDSGFLLSGKSGTQLRRVPVAELRRLAADPSVAELVAKLLERWVAGLAARLTRDVFPKPEADAKLAADKPVQLEKGKRAKSESGVVWVEAEPGSLLFIGMSTLLPEREQVLFPVTPQAWIEPAGEATEGVELSPRSTLAALEDEDLWAGLDLFHQALCECEFINKRLAVVDEFQRLSSKAKQSEAAREAAYDAIGAVLAGRHQEPADFGAAGTVEPVLQACKHVGDALGIKIKSPAEKRAERTFDDHVAAVAGASRFRTRRIALRGEWWKADAGPLLARVEQTGASVALIPVGISAYDWVDPASKSRSKVTPELAATLAPFAYSFYRPFPPGKLSATDLLSFGARGLGADLMTLVSMGLITGVFGAVTPYLTGQMIDSAIPQGERSLLVQLGLGMLIAAVASAAFRITQSIAVVRVESKMDYCLQAALWDRLLDLPSAFFRKYGAGDLADRAAGINAIRGILSRAGVSGILSSISSVAYVFLMMFYSFKLAFVAMLLTFILVGATTLGNYLQLRNQREETTFRGRISGLVLQLISGVAKVRVCAAENHAFRVWAQRFSSQKKLGFAIGQIQNPVATFSSAFQVLSSVGIFGALYYFQSTATTQAEAMAFTTGTFVAFNGAFASFVGATQALADASLSLLRAVPVYERLKPILEAIPETDETKAHAGRLRGEISISHVQFRYREDAPWIVKDISLKINPGEFAAFVGPSGCGKSTMMRLMLGFEKPATGAIYYDGQDMSTLDVKSVRQQLGVVLQESRVLPTDIYRNIVGTTSHTMDEAWEAAEMGGLAEDIRQMPMGMHTVVSEGGGTFSGGQRQRLLIARALVNKPRVIFFDEATSALDNKAQAVVTQSMDRLDATRIVIAHRLSTVVNADKICYFEGGEIREVGTYEELMAKNGLFAELARRQMA